MFHSVEPAPPAKFLAEPSSGLNDAPPAALPAMSGADLQPVERVVTLRAAAPAQSPLARRARPEMAPQAIEKPRFAPENGAPSPARGRRSREARDEGKPAVRQTDRNVRRPKMAPQAIEKSRFAPENGAPLRPRGRRSREARDEGKPAVRQTDRNVRRPKMAPQAIEKLRFAPENGAPPSLSV